MSITTKHLSEVTTSGVTGFGGSAGTPANFANPDDANLFSQITANMDSGASDSRAFNRIALTGLNDWIPASTIATRKIIIKYRQTLTSIGDAPADCHFRSGYKYSLNGGGAFTTVQVDQTGPNLNYDSGILTDEIVLGGGQDISQIIVEAFAEVDKTSGGGTASASHADIQGFHAYVETFEDAVDLMIVRPTSETLTTVGTASTFQGTTNPGNVFDNNLATFEYSQLEHHYVFPSENYHHLDVVNNWPLIPVPTRIVDATIRFKWEGEYLLTRATGTIDVAVQIQTYWSRNGGVGYNSTVSSKYTMDVPAFSFGAGGPHSGSKALELVYYRLTNPNIATDKIKLKWSHFIATGLVDILDDFQFRVASKTYEVWAELRIESSQEVGGGWSDV